MSYLDAYLQRKREEREAGKYEIDDTAGEKFQAFTNNIGITLASALKDIRKGRSVAGSPGSMAIESNAYESVARKVSEDEVKAIGAFSETLGKGSTITNQRLKEAVESLRSMSDTLKDMFNDTMAQRRKSEAYSKRGDAVPSGASAALSDASYASKGSGIFDYLDWRKKDRPRPIGTPNTEKIPTNGQGGWWGRIKDKIGGGAKEGGGLFKKIGGGLKGAGVVGALVGASSLYEAATGDGDNTKNVSKVAGSMAGGALGWQAGATAGGALGALGGPAAPITIPMGALIGGLAGAWGGSEIGDAVADSLVDVVRNFDSVPEQIQKVYKNDIVPGFDKASSFLSDSASTLSATAGKMGDAVANAFSGMTKTLSDFGDNVASGAGKAVRFASALPGRAVEAGREAIKTGADVATTMAKRADTIFSSAQDAVATSFGMNSAKRQFVDGQGNTEVREGGTRAWRNNNEGNIRYGDFAKSKGAIGKDAQGFAIFANQDQGKRAKEDLLFSSKSYRNLSLDDAISRYAPSVENDTGKYQKIVRDAAGVSGSTKMSDMTPEQRRSILEAMKKHEGWKEGKSTYADSKGNPIDASNMKLAISGQSDISNVDSTSYGKIVASDVKKPKPMSVQKADKSPVAKDANIGYYGSAKTDSENSIQKSGSVAMMNATPSSVAPSVEVLRSPVERVSSSEQPESKPVTLTNPSALRQPDENREVTQMDRRPRVVQDSQIPSLENIPVIIDDLGLVLINVGLL